MQFQNDFLQLDNAHIDTHIYIHIYIYTYTYTYTIIQLYNYTILQLYNYTIIQLYNYTYTYTHTYYICKCIINVAKYMIFGCVMVWPKIQHNLSFLFIS